MKKETNKINTTILSITTVMLVWAAFSAAWSWKYSRIMPLRFAIPLGIITMPLIALVAAPIITAFFNAWCNRDQGLFKALWDSGITPMLLFSAWLIWAGFLTALYACQGLGTCIALVCGFLSAVATVMLPVILWTVVHDLVLWYRHKDDPPSHC